MGGGNLPWFSLSRKPYSFSSTSVVMALNEDDFIKINCDPRIHIEKVDGADFILGGVFPTNHLIGEVYVYF